MSITYTARHTRINQEIEAFCEKRVKALEKILGYELETSLILSVEKYRQKAEVNIKTKSGTLHAVVETDDMHSSLVAAFDNLKKRVKKEREKLLRRKRRKIREVEPVILPEEEEQPRLIRSNDYSFKPMSIDEAILQFNSENRDVFAFRKFDSEKWAFLFRRKDGNIGLIEPE
jgi:putative sigma-54 modulation protein